MYKSYLLISPIRQTIKVHYYYRYKIYRLYWGHSEMYTPSWFWLLFFSSSNFRFRVCVFNRKQQVLWLCLTCQCNCKWSLGLFVIYHVWTKTKRDGVDLNFHIDRFISDSSDIGIFIVVLSFTRLVDALKSCKLRWCRSYNGGRYRKIWPTAQSTSGWWFQCRQDVYIAALCGGGVSKQMQSYIR